MPLPATLAAVDEYWARFFACAVEDLHEPRAILLPHAGLEGYPGVFLFRHDPSLIVSAPTELVPSLRRRLLPRAPEDLFNVDTLRSLLGGAVREVIGPAWLGICDASDFRPAEALGARPLGFDDEAALLRLQASNSRADWEYSGIEELREGVVGLYDGQTLVAAGVAEPRGEHILDVGLLTTRSERGKGYGRAVAGALTALGVEAGKIMQYRTPLANEPALAIARSLGYVEYARTIAVRLERATW